MLVKGLAGGLVEEASSRRVGSLGVGLRWGLRCGRREDRRPRTREWPVKASGREKTGGREMKVTQMKVSHAVGLPSSQKPRAFPVPSGPHNAPVGRKVAVSPRDQ